MKYKLLAWKLCFHRIHEHIHTAEDAHVWFHKLHSDLDLRAINLRSSLDLIAISLLTEFLLNKNSQFKSLWQILEPRFKSQLFCHILPIFTLKSINFWWNYKKFNQCSHFSAKSLIEIRISVNSRYFIFEIFFLLVIICYSGLIMNWMMYFHSTNVKNLLPNHQ